MTIHYDFGCDYEYEVDYKELRQALVKILCDNAKDIHQGLFEEGGAFQMANYVVYELDIVDELCENLKEALTDYFYSKAERQYEERCENDTEEDDWYGTMSDVRGI